MNGMLANNAAALPGMAPPGMPPGFGGVPPQLQALGYPPPFPPPQVPYSHSQAVNKYLAALSTPAAPNQDSPPLLRNPMTPGAPTPSASSFGEDPFGGTLARLRAEMAARAAAYGMQRLDFFSFSAMATASMYTGSAWRGRSQAGSKTALPNK